MDLLGEVEDQVGLACPPLDDMFFMGEIESESCLSGLGDLDGFFDEVGDDGNVKKPKKITVGQHRYGNSGKGKDIENLFPEPEINCESITPETHSSTGSDSCLSDGDVKKKKKIIIRLRCGKGKDIKNLFLESPNPNGPSPIGPEETIKQPIRHLGKGEVFEKQPGINKSSNIMDYNSKLEASKRRLREGYEAADRAKRQRVIQIIKPRDLPRISSTGNSCRFKNKQLQKLYQNQKSRPGFF